MSCYTVYTLVTALVSLGIWISIWLKNKYSYWEKRGVAGPRPFPFIGNALGIMLARESVHDFARNLYESFPKEKMVGYYQAMSPALVLRDPELIKEVTVKSYENFNSRGMRHRDDEFEDNLFLGEGETWKILRRKFNPVFTSGKVKLMVPLIESCLDDFLQYIDRLISSGRSEQDVKEICRLLTLDINGTCCFGVSMDVYSEKQNVFVDLADNIFTYVTTLGVRRVIEMLFPGFVKILTKWFNIQGHIYNLRTLFDKLIKSVVKGRAGNTSKHGDLMDLFVDLKEEGIAENGKAKVVMDDEFVATQAITLYIAGFEPTSLFLSFMIYEMALNEDIQQRVFEEITEIANKNGGKVTYEGTKDMVYLKMVFEETLRKYTGSLSRECYKTCTFPDHNITIEKGTNIIIPLAGLHNDPKYFEDPDVFNPERFAPENRSKVPSMVYLPFGEGPRHCIGKQFGRVQCLLGAARIFHRLRVYPTARTPRDPRRLTIDPRYITLRILDHLWVGIATR